VKDKGTQGGTNASLIINATQVIGGYRNNEVSLGTSDYRWSDVYSVNGDFNGAVTIHSSANGTELLRFNTERPWKFSQIGTGATASLYLSPDTSSKGFVIAEPDNSKVFEFLVNGSYSRATFNSTLTVANLATFYNRVLIGNVVDDGSSTLQLYGDISAHSTNINFRSTGSWAKGLYALDPNGNRLGGIGFYVNDDVLDKIWIGSFGDSWIAITSTEANFNVLTKFNSSVKIGEATLSYENGALKVDKNFFAEGEVASGKVAAEGTGGNTPSGSGLEIKTFDIASTTDNQMVECVHNLGTQDVVVQIFENSQNSNYQQVFADVYYVDTAKVAINFGAAQTVPHRVIIMG
jgi:hypothetical protein